MCCAIVLFVARGARAISSVDSPIGTKYIRTDFTVDDGLPDNTVDAVTQTDNGLLWEVLRGAAHNQHNDQLDDHSS